MFYITGDKHGHIESIKKFAKRFKTSTEDVLIILGDAGFNYFVEKDPETKLYKDKGALNLHKELADIPLTIIVVQGNHEAPAWYCKYMQQKEAFGNTVYYTATAPNVMYLKNGEIYEINNKKYLVMGGAYSIDKWVRAVPSPKDYPAWLWYDGYLRTSPKQLEFNNIRRCFWFPEEQMSEKEYTKATEGMRNEENQIHGILAHTCPISKVPKELFLDLPSDSVFLPVDYTMEEKFEEMIKDWKFDKWYFGHYHGDFKIDETYEILYNTFKELE